MIQPTELKLDLPIDVHNAISTTSMVWEMLTASYEGNLERVQSLAQECPGLLYAQYNYTPPIHFAVREGHVQLVAFLLDQGALDPTYRIYPFLDSLLTLAQDRNDHTITSLLQQYLSDPSLCKFSGDNGRIYYNRTELEQAFEDAVDKEDLEKTERMLKDYPALALDETYFWSEGILLRPCKEGNFKLADLLMQYGARMPNLLKWAQFYYFERYDSAVYLMGKGMNPNVMSWHHVTILHDMAQKGFIDKAALLLKHGADINPIDEEYQSTPLGMAARWGHEDMVAFLLQAGADPNKAGAPWATPLAWAQKKGHRSIETILLQAGAH